MRKARVAFHIGRPSTQKTETSRASVHHWRSLESRSEPTSAERERAGDRLRGCSTSVRMGRGRVGLGQRKGDRAVGGLAGRGRLAVCHFLHVGAAEEIGILVCSA